MSLDRLLSVVADGVHVDPLLLGAELHPLPVSADVGNGSSFVAVVPPGVQVDPSSPLSAISSVGRSREHPGRHTSSAPEEWDGVKPPLLKYEWKRSVRKEYKIIKVPEQLKEKNTSIIKTTISLKDNSINAAETRTMKGYEMVDFIYDVKFSKKDKTAEEYLNNKYKIGNNKTTYNNINLGDLSTKNESYAINYDLEINNYAKRIGSKIYLNLNIEKPLSKGIILNILHC